MRHFVESIGPYNLLFLLYFATNILDAITGLNKGVKRGEYSTKIFLNGVVLKIGRWVIVLVAVILHLVLIVIGAQTGLDLSFAKAIVWFTLAVLIFQEIRSIFDNLIAIGISVPPVFMKTLLLAEKKLDDQYDGDLIIESSDDKDTYRLELNDAIETLKDKDAIVFKVRQDQ